MRFNSEYAFPHPVLGIREDISGSAQTSVAYDEETDPDNYILTIQYQLNNSDLNDLIAKLKAVFFCDLSCTGTLFRRSEASSNFIQTITVPKNAVRERVDLLFLLIAREDIPGYQNAQANPDFEGYQFDIDKGDVLAYMGEGSFFAGLAYQQLKAVSSFLEITKGKKETGNFEIILEGSKIEVELSVADYDRYSQPSIGKTPDLASTFHAAIVLPALIHALYQLVAGPTQSRDELSETPWAKIIKYRLENEEDAQGLALAEEHIVSVAQYLLGSPLERLLKDLSQRTLTEEED